MFSLKALRLGVRHISCLQNTPSLIRSCSNGTSALSDVDDAEVVIIGGGVVGASTAYHLAKGGLERVVLLEQYELTAGSTWHSTGMTTHYQPGVNLKMFHYETMKLFETLPEETGQDVGFHPCGSIRLANNAERMDEFRYHVSRNGNHLAPMRLISKEETLERHPFINPDLILGGLFTEGDGYVDPYCYTQALAMGARQYGARIIMAKVEGTTQLKDGSWTLDTSLGQLNTKRVINAAGFWARDVGKLSGVDLPVTAVHHTYVTTAPLPEVEALDRELPVIRDLDTMCYMRQERKGLCAGPYESWDRVKVKCDWYDNGVDQGLKMPYKTIPSIDTSYAEAPSSCISSTRRNINIIILSCYMRVLWILYKIF